MRVPAVVFLALLADPYSAQILQWRAAREAALKADWGWLTVVGLHWLHPGSNTVPGIKGDFTLDHGQVTWQGRALRPDNPGPPDLLPFGGTQAFLIRRGDRYGIRVKDLHSPFRRDFTALRWFPVNEAYRVTARFVPEPRKLPVPNILGQAVTEECPGYVIFALAGRELRLYPVLEEPGAKEWFFVFRDLTSHDETYGGGRFLYADLPEDGKVLLDFNKAYNPPCAFTPYATCPLPPPENRLPVRIPAGELRYRSH